MFFKNLSLKILSCFCNSDFSQIFWKNQIFNAKNLSWKNLISYWSFFEKWIQCSLPFLVALLDSFSILLTHPWQSTPMTWRTGSSTNWASLCRTYKTAKQWTPSCAPCCVVWTMRRSGGASSASLQQPMAETCCCWQSARPMRFPCETGLQDNNNDKLTSEQMTTRTYGSTTTSPEEPFQESDASITTRPFCTGDQRIKTVTIPTRRYPCACPTPRKCVGRRAEEIWK